MRSNAHVGIAGAGLLGRLLAWQLLEKGCRVSLYEAGSLKLSKSAAYTAAGMVAPVSEAIDTEPLMYQMGVAALDIWPQWLAELAATDDNFDKVSYSTKGSLVVAHPKDHLLLTQYMRDMEQLLPPEAQGTVLNRDELHELEPDIGEYFRQGLWLRQEAHIDNRSLLRVLLKRIQALGCQCFENTAVSISGNRLTVNGAVETFDLVLDCRGVGAKGLEAKDKIKKEWSEVRGVRGEVLRVTLNEVVLQRPVRLLHPRYQLYVVPAANHQFIIGATQIESDDDSPVSVQSCLELCSALYTINPAFAEARIIELTANLRPALNDNRPRVLWDRGLARINGLYRHGYLLAPVVVSHVMSSIFNTTNKLSQPFNSVLDHFVYGSDYADCLH